MGWQVMKEKKSSNNSFENVLNKDKESSFFIEIPSPIFAALNSEQQSNALLLASKLDISAYKNVLQFGADVQQTLKDFTHNMLVTVQRNDTSSIREILNKLIEQLEKINPEDLIENKKGFFNNIFKRQKSTIQELISQYNRLSKHIDRLSIQLQHAQKGLLADLNMLNDMYQLNEDYFHNINIYIAAAELKKQDIVNNVLPKVEQTAMESKNPLDKQRLVDLKTSIEWLDKRLYDLQISREIAIQTAPQIRLMQQTNQMLVEKIQASVMSTIPLWQSQISMLIQINNQRRANMTSGRLMEAHESMMKKNAKMLEATSADSKRYKTITHEDIDSFKETQLQLIESIEDTLRVQAKSNEQQAFIEAKMKHFN